MARQNTSDGDIRVILKTKWFHHNFMTIKLTSQFCVNELWIILCLISLDKLMQFLQGIMQPYKKNKFLVLECSW